MNFGVGGLSIGGPGEVLAVGESVADGGPLLTRRRPDADEAVARVALGYWTASGTICRGR